MRVVIKNDYEDLSQWAANYVVYTINKFKPSPRKPFVLGLPCGSTPLGMFKYLIQYYKQGKISFADVVVFSVAEYVGISPENPNSFQRFLWDNFLQYVNIKKEHCFFLNGLTTDYAKECSTFEKQIQKFGGVNLFVGGIGVDGHIAFNEPYSSLCSRTRVKLLTPSTLRNNSRFFDNDVEKVPHMVLTIGIATMMDAEEVMILANGEQKSLALKNAIEGAITHAWPISALQSHPHGIIACDDEATKDLSIETVMYFKEIEKNNF